MGNPTSDTKAVGNQTMAAVAAADAPDAAAAEGDISADSDPGADAAIAAGRDRAMANVRTVAAETAEAIVEKLSGQAPSRAEVDAAIARNAA